MNTLQLSDLRAHGVIAVLRAPTPDAAVSAAEALVRGGIKAIEVTYSTPEPAAVIKEIARRFGQSVLLGAGTLTRPDQADAVVEAGAQFLVSPGSVPEVAASMTKTGALVMLGALTPTEVMQAIKLEARVVKVFPASLGGPSYLRSLRAPFPHVPFMPTGGVSPHNLADWFDAGAIAVGAGGELVSGTDLAAERWDNIEENARRYAEALAQSTAAPHA